MEMEIIANSTGSWGGHNVGSLEFASISANPANPSNVNGIFGSNST